MTKPVYVMAITIKKMQISPRCTSMQWDQHLCSFLHCIMLVDVMPKISVAELTGSSLACWHISEDRFSHDLAHLIACLHWMVWSFIHHINKSM